MSSGLIVSTDYPLYTVVCLRDGEIAIGGGGGAAKTGVPNAMEIHRIILCHNDRKKEIRLETEQIAHVNTRTSPVMNSAAAPTGSAVACGLDEHCRIFRVIGETGGRTKSSSRSTVRLEEGPSCVTDFFQKFPAQKAVRFSWDGSMVATGGLDGHIRLWKSTTLKMERNMKESHTDDVDDLDFHPLKPLLVSVSRDRTISVWRVSSGERVGQLKFSRMQTNKLSYRARSCRFMPPPPGGVSAMSSAPLFTAHCPVQLDPSKAPPSYLVRWQTDGELSSWKEERYVSLGRDPVTCISCLSLSSVGYVGVGTMEGSVKIYDSVDLSCLSEVQNLHSLYVTGVTMTRVPVAEPKALPGETEPGLISVSADRSCCVTVIRPQKSYSVIVLFAALLVIVALFVMFAL